MSSLFDGGGEGMPKALQRKLENRARAQAIKDRCGVHDVAGLRGANPVAEAFGWRADCPACHAAGTAKISAHGENWRCSAYGCGAEGDVITFEMAATGRDFAGACLSLEAAFCSGRRDAATGDLFALADAGGRVS